MWVQIDDCPPRWAVEPLSTRLPHKFKGWWHVEGCGVLAGECTCAVGAPSITGNAYLTP